jgi:hypothetical protein
MKTNKIQVHSGLLSEGWYNKKNIMWFYFLKWNKVYEDVDDFLMTDGKVTVDLIVRI